VLDYPGCPGKEAVKQIVAAVVVVSTDQLAFLADCTIGRAFGTVSRLSVVCL